jgi:hypothetical protein
MRIESIHAKQSSKANKLGNIMSKAFKIESPFIESEEFTLRQYLNAGARAGQYIGAYGVDGAKEQGFKFFLYGEECTGNEFCEAVDAAYDAWLEKKEKTHKYVKVRHGDSFQCYCWKWIPKK